MIEVLATSIIRRPRIPPRKAPSSPRITNRQHITNASANNESGFDFPGVQAIGVKGVHNMRQLITPILLSLLSIAGCGGGSNQNGNLPAAAVEMDAELKSNMTKFMPKFSTIESSLLFVLIPGSPMAQGVTVTPDTSPGAPPFTVTFSGPYDGNGDGFNETTMSGNATFNSDPSDFSVSWSGVSGQVAIDASIPLIGHVYHGDVTFTILPDQRRISGSGTFTEPITGDTTTMTIPDGSPLVMMAADGTAGAIANACGYSLSGQIRLDVTGPDGTLTSYWNFNPNSSTVAVNGASFTDTSGNSTALPDSSVSLICNSGSMNNWVGTFDQYWACLPYEFGQSRITIAATGPDTISITDEDPPGSGDIKNYSATAIGANTRAVRGFFIGGPVGARYREDFNWTLRKNGNGYSQVSRYVFTEGSFIGNGGICVASATRIP